MIRESSSKPSLLLIAGYFPPVRISTGSIRPWNLARCLIELGWEVTVVTPRISIWNEKHLDNIENVKETIAKFGIKMIYTDHSLKCLAPWRYNVPSCKLYWFLGGILRKIAQFIGFQNWGGWVPSALKACKDLKPGDVDVILATGAPFWGFTIAYRLSKRLKRPFIMDYRDLWTDNPWSPVNQKWVINQERKLLQNCAAVTIVSPISGEVLGEKYKVKHKVVAITNGYDVNDVMNVKALPFNHFSIIFAGSLISARMTLATLFKVLTLVKEKSQNGWRFHYFGPNSDVVIREVAEWGLQQESIIHGNIPRQELLPYLKGAGLNIVLSSNSQFPTMEDKGVIPGKVFELIGLKASILPIVPKGSAVEGIMADVGITSFDHQEVEKIADYIMECICGYHPTITNNSMYSWEELAKKFDVLLKNLSKNING